MEEVDKGSFYAKGLLELTPCDLWPYIRGKTIWLIGDSIMQVRLPCTGACTSGFPLRNWVMFGSHSVVYGQFVLDNLVDDFQWT